MSLQTRQLHRPSQPPIAQIELQGRITPFDLVAVERGITHLLARSPVPAAIVRLEKLADVDESMLNLLVAQVRFQIERMTAAGTRLAVVAPSGPLASPFLRAAARMGISAFASRALAEAALHAPAPSAANAPAGLAIKIARVPGVAFSVVAKLFGELTAVTVAHFDAAMHARLAAGDKLFAVKFAEVTAIDATGIDALLRLQSAIVDVDGTMLLVDCPDAIRASIAAHPSAELLRMLGKYLNVHLLLFAYRLPPLDLKNHVAPPEMLRRLPENVARQHRLVPFSMHGEEWVFACANESFAPATVTLLGNLVKDYGVATKTVLLARADEAAIDAAIARSYAALATITEEPPPPPTKTFPVTVIRDDRTEETGYAIMMAAPTGAVAHAPPADSPADIEPSPITEADLREMLDGGEIQIRAFHDKAPAPALGGPLGAGSQAASDSAAFEGGEEAADEADESAVDDRRAELNFNGGGGGGQGAAASGEAAHDQSKFGIDEFMVDFETSVAHAQSDGQSFGRGGRASSAAFKAEEAPVTIATAREKSKLADNRRSERRAEADGREEQKQKQPEPLRDIAAGETLERRTTVRFYRQMNPMTTVPLLVLLTKAEVAKIVQKHVGQATGRGVKIKKANPFVTIVPRIPGCIVVPDRREVDVRPESVEAQFFVTPLAAGDYGHARVEIWYEGKIIDTVATPTRVVTQFAARMAAIAGVLNPLIFGGLKMLGINIDETMDRDGVIMTLAHDYFHGSLIELGLFAAGIGAAVALGFYWWNRPRKADPVTQFLNWEAAGNEG